MRGVINKHFNLVRICTLLVVALLLLILFPVYIKEDGASATTGTATASTTSLTIASGKNTASVAITPTNAGGAFATSSSANKAEFGISTNNYTGYTLAITASDDTGNLVNTSTNDTIASITTNLTESSFNTSANNNKWGFKPNKYVSNNAVINNTGDGSVYLPSPTTTPTLLDKTNVANSTANNYTITLGIRVDNNTYSGSYAKTFTLVATANPSTYAINYSKNTTDTVSNLPSTSTTGSTSSTTINLPNTVPTRAHYSFLGWCSTTTTTNNGIDSCSGTVYNPNGNGTNLTYGLDQTTANTTTLYAMWKIDTFTQTTEVRYENENGTWGNYSTVDTQILSYGSSYSWSTSQISGFNSSIYQSASVSSYTVTGAKTNQVSIYRKTYTCYIQSRHQNAGGDYTGYTARVNTTLRYGQTCSWSSPADTTYQSASYSATITSNISQSLDINRQQYYLTVNRNSTYISSVSGSGYYRVGQAATISATASSGNEFTSWSQTAGTTGSFANANSSSTYFYMPASNATVYANGKSSKLYLQNVTSATCPTTATTAYDNRDEEACTIQKLADGKCWLLDNLRLDLTNATVKNNLTASTTNASATTLNYLKNGGGTTSDQYAILGVANWNGSDGRSSPLIATSGSCSSSDLCANNPSSGQWTKDSLLSYGNGMSKIGIYYNYCAASAGSYCYSSNRNDIDATEDICPKGWRMPTGGSSGEYQALYIAYSSNAANFDNALRAPLSGYVYGNGSSNNQTRTGFFWSSTQNKNNSGYVHSLYLYNSNVYPEYNGMDRRNGFSVRCILK